MTPPAPGRLLRSTREDDTVTSPNSCAALRDRLAGLPLLPSELAILRHLTDGLTVAQVAARMGSRPGTVRTTLRRVYAKLGARNARHAIALAANAGLLVPCLVDGQITVVVSAAAAGSTAAAGPTVAAS